MDIYLFWILLFSPSLFLLTFSCRRFLKGQGCLAVFSSRTFGTRVFMLAKVPWHIRELNKISKSGFSTTLREGESPSTEGARGAMLPQGHFRAL